jgi:hypothetical protein
MDKRTPNTETASATVGDLRPLNSSGTNMTAMPRVMSLRNDSGTPEWTSGFPAYATIPQWCRLSGIGRSSTYEAMGRGDLIARKLGTRTLIDVAHGLAWLDNLPAAAIRTGRKVAA